MKINIFKIPQLTVLFFLFSVRAYAQFPGSPSVDAGSDVTLTCSDPCTNLTAAPFHTGATNTYVANSIPHTPPISYTEPGGTPVSVNTDDVWSPIINLPFTFCYYGQYYNTVKIGSNGALLLGPASSGGFHPWELTTPVPSTDLTDAGHIFGVFHDIDPTIAGTVQWYVTGTAPSRIFVVVYNQLGQYGCPTLRSTFMTVLYETTNVIDVYVNEKQTCTSWNSGNALIGIQNTAGTQGIAAPGRNTGAWSVSTPEAWRFSPDGAPIYTVEWLEGGNVIATGLTVNVCPTTQTTYTAQATYNSCDGQTIVVQDDVTVTPPANAPSLSLSTEVPASCGGSDGELTVSGSGGTPGYLYSIDGGTTFQGSNTFTGLPAGNYTILIQDNTGCLGSGNFEVTENSTLDLNLSATNITCFGDGDGEIIATGQLGAGSYTYSLNGGAFQANGTFSNLSAGFYTVTVQDANNCSVQDTVTLFEPDELLLSISDFQDVSCFGLSDGYIHLNAVGGTGSLEYSIPGDTTQSSPDFNNLSAGNYTLVVTDQNGCSDTVTQTLTEPAAPNTTIQFDTTHYCALGGTVAFISGDTGGTFSSTAGLSIDPSSGSVDLAASSPGTYTVDYTYTNAGGCSYITSTDITVLELPNVYAGEDQILCDGESWTVNATGAVNYSWNGGIQNGDVLTPGVGNYSYIVIGEGANGCFNADTIEITLNTQPQVNISGNPLSGTPPLEVVFGNNSTGADNYSWTFGNGQTSGSGGATVSTVYNQTGTYTVTLTGTTNEGCTDQASLTVFVQYANVVYEIPNVFTPNNDNSNDFFLINYFSGIENIVDFEIVILNRWGNVMATFDDPQFKWNGTSSGGGEASDGVYFYKFNFTTIDDKEVEGHGFVHLVRAN
ncbi:MAG: gliding motility-associated C-terminal domain-containing protein [Brumimicrobium sp.]|nr:gliding motility-associated C-terminal domain-containing protein [Brumimicrobium sp.]